MASPTYYTAVDLRAQAFEPLAKHNSLYVAALSPPLTVVTPPVQLETALAEQEAPFAYLRPAGAFAAWLRGAEAWVLDECVRRKSEWFHREVDDDALRLRFKSFFRPEDGAFKVKAPEGEVALFGEDGLPVGPEEVPPGQHVRCVLELSRFCFGRQEFGAMWRLVQARVTRVPECLIADEDPADDSDDSGGPEEAACGDGAAADAEEGEFV